MRRMLIGIGILTLGLLTAACSASGGTGGTLDGTSWILKSYDVGGTATNVPVGVVVDARFADGKVAGFAGCNRYTAEATIADAKLTVGPAATTMMACEPVVTAVETAYLANLALSATFTATADALTIFGADGKQLLAYAAGAANPLVGQWNVTGYNNGQEAVTSPIAGTTLTVVFTPDGQVSGNAGCNTFNGGYTLEGTSLTAGPLATTMKACEPEVMNQEAAFLTALQTPTTVEPSGETVTLRDASGATQVTLAGN